MDVPTLYCEFLAGDPHQFVNTISSLSFLLGAYVVYSLARTKDWFTYLLAGEIALISIGSLVWHHHSSPSGDLLDTVSIGLFALTVLFGLLGTLLKQRWLQIVFALLLLAGALFIEQLLYFNGSLVYICLILLLAAVLGAISIRYPDMVKLVIISLFTLSVGVVFRSIDVAVCDHFYVGTHFLWHILAAISATSLALVVLDLKQYNFLLQK